jgi:hypothetical protein
LKKANDLHISKNLESDVKKRLDFDIELLQENQPNLINKLDDFRTNNIYEMKDKLDLK